MRRLPLAVMLAALVVAVTARTGVTGGLVSTVSPLNWTLGGVPTGLIEVPAAAPVGITACPGVRPGAIVNSQVGQCTFNFVFDGTDGRTYVGTAGHCILGDSPFGGDVGEMSWAPGTGPEAQDAAGARIGEFAYAILLDPKDFSLIRVDPGIAVSPQVCHFGGPTGLNADTPSGLVVLHHYGNGVAVGTVLPARTAVAAGMPSPDHVFAQGVAVPGDSGSGVISDDGRAVGVLVTIGVHSSSIGTSGVDAGFIGITRIVPQRARAASVLGVELTLATAPPL